VIVSRSKLSVTDKTIRCFLIKTLQVHALKRIQEDYNTKGCFLARLRRLSHLARNEIKASFLFRIVRPLIQTNKFTM